MTYRSDMSMKIKSYLVKKGLMNYNQNKKLLKELELKKEELENRLYSISNSSVVKKAEGTPKKRSTIIIERMQNLDEINKQIEICRYEIKLVDEFIGSLSKHRQLVVDKYIKECSQKELETKYSISIRSIYRLIERLIEDFGEIG